MTISPLIMQLYNVKDIHPQSKNLFMKLFKVSLIPHTKLHTIEYYAVTKYSQLCYTTLWMHAGIVSKVLIVVQHNMH